MMSISNIKFLLCAILFVVSNHNFAQNSLLYPSFCKDTPVASIKQNTYGNIILDKYSDTFYAATSNSNVVKKEFSVLSGSENKSFSMGSDDDTRNILGMFVFAGYGKLRFNFENKSLYTFNQAYIKGGGLSLDIPLPMLSERFSLYNELSFSQFKAETNFRISDTASSDPGTNYYDINMQFSPNILTISNCIKYTLTPGSFKYYVALGIYNSFVISATNLKRSDRYTNGIVKTEYEDAVPNSAFHGLMLLASTGFSYKNIGLEFRFDPGRNYSNKVDYAVYMPNFQAILHICFNPK